MKNVSRSFKIRPRKVGYIPLNINKITKIKRVIIFLMEDFKIDIFSKSENKHRAFFRHFHY
jgi:hypothetical protein